MKFTIFVILYREVDDAEKVKKSFDAWREQYGIEPPMWRARLDYDLERVQIDDAAGINKLVSLYLSVREHFYST